MKQGTTPTHIFELPFETSLIAKVRVLYRQDGKVKLRKEHEECSLNGNTISIRLTQEETLMFDCTSPVEIQLRVITLGGDSLVSDKRLVSNEECFEREVFS